MRIPLFDRLFSKPEQTEPLATKKEANPEPIQTGIAQARDSFESVPQSSSAAGNLFPSSNSKADQVYSRDQNQNSDDVVVRFEHGEIRSPYVVGGLWNSKDTPPTSADSDSDSEKDSNKKNRD